MTSPLRWPKRFRDRGGDRPLDARLAALFDGCAATADPPEGIIRIAAREALKAPPAEAHLRRKLQDLQAGCAALFRSRRALVGLGLAAVLQIGFALASERGRKPWNDVRSWLRSSLMGPVTLGQPELPVVASIPGLAASPQVNWTPMVPMVARPPPAPVAMLSERAHRQHRTISAPAGLVEARSPALEPSSTDSLALEARMVSSALALLDTDPRRTLAQLENYRRSFPAGALQGEAALTELRALQALGDTRAALAALDRLATEDFASAGARGAELRTSRLELMAGASRCREALAQVEWALATATSPRLQGRLLLVRASCRATTGDPAGSTRDLQQYLAVFPDGPRAAEIRRRMNGGD